MPVLTEGPGRSVLQEEHQLLEVLWPLHDDPLLAADGDVDAMEYLLQVTQPVCLWEKRSLEVL